jgi:ketosteroid isomerase-like protein
MPGRDDDGLGAKTGALSTATRPFASCSHGGATVRKVARDDVDVVRAAVTAHEGRDLAAFIREGLGDVDPDDAAELERLVAVWVAEDPMVRHFASDIVWDATAIGVTGTAGGLHELAAWYRDWMGLWETYVYRVVEIREADGWIITPTDVRARGRDGIELEMRVFQLWRVRDGKVVVMRAFLTEQEALAAAAAG